MSVFQLLINGADSTPNSEWDATWEEQIDGVGAASITVQDRDNSNLDYGHERDTVEIRVDGSRAFTGEITRSRLDLPPGRPWRRWKITASDFNTVLDLRLVGVPDGYSWHSVDGAKHEAYDPDAHGLASDQLTVRALFDKYARLPDGAEFGTSTFVGRYIPRNVMVDAATGETHLHWTHTTLRSSLDEMRGLAGFPLFVWIDPDYEVHWTALPEPFRGARVTLGPRPSRLVSAPAVVTDHDTDGTSRIGGRGLFIEWDGSYMPQQAYVAGVTDFVYGAASTGGTYTVVSGDTLWAIALRLGVVGGWPALYEENRALIDATARAHGFTGDFSHWIFPGEILAVDLPGGSVAAPRFQGTGFEKRHRRHLAQRQIQVDAQAITEAQKDAVAAHYLKFGERARIKGSVTVGRPDEAVHGWRCGQLVRIEDDRLPAFVNGKRYAIQRVAGKLHAGRDDFAEYTLEFGDAPIGRFSEKYQTSPHRIRDKHLAARVHRIYMPTVHLRPSTSYIIHSQMVDNAHKPVRHGGVPVVWSLIVKDRTGATVSAGSIVAIRSVTDHHGRTAATLTTGGATDLHYHTRCVTRPQ